MPSIINVLVYIFVSRPAEARFRVLEFLDALETHWWHSSVVCSLIGLFYTFPISILNFIVIPKKRNS